MKISGTSIFLLLFIMTSCAQDSTTVNYKEGYQIDKSLEVNFDKKEATLGNTLDVHNLYNDKEKEGLLSGKKSPFYSPYTVENDTIKIILMHMLYPTGIFINIYGDSVWAYHFISSKDTDLRPYKKNITDKDYQYSPNAAPKSFTLVLTEKPSSNKNIKGYVNFKSSDFYEKSDNEDIKRNYNIEGYFIASKLF